VQWAFYYRGLAACEVEVARAGLQEVASWRKSRTIPTVLTASHLRHLTSPHNAAVITSAYHLPTRRRPV
jgi:hypothetical protein